MLSLIEWFEDFRSCGPFGLFGLFGLYGFLRILGITVVFSGLSFSLLLAIKLMASV